MKKTLGILLAAVMTLCLLSLIGSATVGGSGLVPYALAADVVGSGSCGAVDTENGLDGSQVTWQLDSDGVLTINGKGAMKDFQYYSTDCPWASNRSAVKSVVIGSGVTSIGSSAFYYCSNMTSVTIPKTVKTIGNYAFYCCYNLPSVVVPEGVTDIGNYAFEDCSRMTTVSLPGSLKTIGNRAFEDCYALMAVSIPDSVTDIGYGAFQYCQKLTSATLPKGLTVINSSLFYNCSALASVVIPDTVTSIGSQAFYQCAALTKVAIPAKVESIGSSAFTGCPLAQFTVAKGNTAYHSAGNCLIATEAKTLIAGGSGTAIPSDGSVTTIGENAFSNRTDLTEITIPKGVTSIGSNAFNNCTALAKITLPDGLTAIGSSAFSNCTALTAIDLPDSVTFIDSYAFYSCKGLTEIAIPAGVKDIAYELFQYCEGLKKVTLPDGLTTIGAYAFYGCKSLEEITIPDRVTSIGNYAFYNCAGLTKLTLPESVTEIYYSAFSNCTGLTEIVLPSGLTSISDSLLAGCTGLTTVTIPKNVSSIGNSAFYGCTGLTSVTIPGAVTRIGQAAFRNCSGLTKITIPKAVSGIGTQAFAGCALKTLTVAKGNATYTAAGNCVIATESKTLVAGCDTSVIPTDGSVEAIGPYAFAYCAGLKKATVPESVISLGDYAFYHCTGLTEVTLPEGLTSIGSYAFGYCSALPAITIPEGVTKISNYAFYDCYALTDVTIPEGVTEIGYSAFNGCSRLAVVSLPDSVTKIDSSAFYGYYYNYYPIVKGNPGSYAQTWAKENKRLFVSLGSGEIVASGYCGEVDPENGLDGSQVIWQLDADGVLTVSGKGAMADSETALKYGDNTFTALRVESGVTAVGKNAFAGCANLCSVTLADSVTTIGQRAFYNCYRLTELVMSKGVTAIGDYAFYYCRNLSAVALPKSLKSVGSYAFYDCDRLTSVSLAKGLTAIGDYAFYDCDGLTGVTLPDTVTSIGKNVFNGCGALKQAVLPKGLTAVPDGMFAGCYQLEEISLPQSVTTIGESAFSGCSNLTSITIPENVTTIGGYAFSGCSNLTSITIPENVTSIGNSAFYYCTGLTSVTIPEGVPTIDDYTFYNCTGLTSVTIPEGVTSIGNYAFYQCSALAAVKLPDSLNSIGYEAFYGCKALTSVTVPANVTSIGSRAFANTGLKTIKVAKGNKRYRAAGNCLIDDASKAVIAGFADSVIPTDGTVTAIAEYAFYGCAGLTEMTIPDTVTVIGRYAFGECTGLKSVTLPTELPGLSEYLFYRCTALEEIAIPDSVKSISNYAFYGCAALKEIVIPDSVTGIGSNAFSDCTALTSIDLPTGLTYINSSLFSGCAALTGVEIPDSVKSIGSYAFSGCKGLTELTIPDSVTGIGYRAFYGCTGLTSVTLPTGLTYIDDYLFYNCTSLTAITIPDNVKYIDYNAFYGCKSLTDIIIPDGVTTIGSAAFYGCTGLNGIIIPESVKSISSNSIPVSTVVYGFAGSYAEEWAANNGLVFVPLGDVTVTLFSPQAVNEPTANVYGFANPGASVRLFVNDEEAAKVTAAVSGRWTAALALPEAKAGDTFTVKAQAKSGDNTEEATAQVTYQPDAVVFKEMTMTHGSYSVNLKAENLGGALPNFNFSAKTYTAFSVKVSNSDKINTLYVVSTKDEGANRMTLSYNAESDVWVGSGYFDNTDSSYIPGALSFTGYDKEGKEFDCGVSIKLNFMVAPSGFVYEAVQSNRLNGVTATMYKKDDAGHELVWNAASTGQVNPTRTYSDGTFSWVVPKGEWQVRLSKEGYQDAATEWMTVPPTPTNICIPMVTTTAPTVTDCNVYFDRADITFSQYMNIDSVTSETVKFEGYTGTLTPTDKTETESGSGIYYAKSFTYRPSRVFTGDVDVTISGVRNYAGIGIAEAYTKSASIEAAPRNLAAAQNVSVVCGKTAEVAITARYAKGKVVTVSCDNANISLSASRLTLDETGTALLTVTGKTPGTARLTISMVGTTLTTKTTVTVTAADGTPDLSQWKDDNALGQVNFTVVNAQTLKPLRGAVVTVTTEKFGTQKATTDANGSASLVLPTGKQTATVTYPGYIVRTLSFTVKHQINTLPSIGISDQEVVDASLTVQEMTYDEIIDAGIDVDDPENYNVVKYTATFVFESFDFIVDEEDDKVYVSSGDGWQEGGGVYVSELNAVVYPAEKFFLVVSGEVKWLKEMFHVQMYVWNNSQTDTLEDLDATLKLPKGLSLAKMESGEQTLTNHIEKIPEGGDAVTEWFVRGDEAGTYSITATLTGKVMPFAEEFTHTYTSDDTITVYGTGALQFTFKSADKMICGEKYWITISLTNVSEHTLYNVSHMITGVEAFKVEQYKKGADLPVKVKQPGSQYDPYAFDSEMAPGDRLDLTFNVQIDYPEFYERVFNLTDFFFESDSLATAIHENFGYAKAHSYGDWKEETSDYPCLKGIKKRTCLVCGYEDVEYIYGDGEHTPGEAVIEPIKEATCAEEGEQTVTVTCVACEKIISQKTEKIPVNDKHVWDEGKVTKEPTCAKEGEKTFTCTVCETTKTETIQPTGNHTWDNGTVTKEPTCAKKGTKTYTCTVCETTKTEDIPATGKHTWNKGKIDPAPTCVDDGVKTYTCTVCKATKTETVKATGIHTWDDGEVTTQPTCVDKGEKLFTCTVCKATKTEDIEPTGVHTWNKGKVTKQPTCVDKGVKTYTCTVCKATKKEDIKPTGVHTWDEGKVTTEPTCLDKGVKTFTCTVCKATRTEDVKALGHKWDKGKVTTKPTCEEKGVRTYTCERCAETKTKDVDPTGHTPGEPTETIDKQPNCTYEGEKTVTVKCKVCEKVLSETKETLPVNGEHVWDEGMTRKEPTCKDEGETLYTCTLCSATKTEPIPVNDNHTWNDGETTIPANCVKAGEMTYTCTLCGKTKTEEIAPNDEHQWDDGEVTKAANCKDEGEMTYTCVLCSQKKTEVIPVNDDHTWDEGKVTTPSTCKDAGEMTFTCTRCNAVRTEPAPLAEHTPGEWIFLKKPNYREGGQAQRECEVCGYVETKDFDKIIPDIIKEDEGTGVTIGYMKDTYESDIELKVTNVFDGDSYSVLSREKARFLFEIFDIATLTGDVPTQPGGSVLVKLPIPAGFNRDHLAICCVTGEGTVEQMDMWIEDDFACCETTYCGVYALVDGSAEVIRLGDVDGDGNITSADARLALRRSVKLEDYAEWSVPFRACDVDFDGNASSADARSILRVSVKLEKEEDWR